VLDARRGDEPIREVLQGSGSPPDHQDLQAVVVIEVYVERRDDLREVTVLRRGEPARKEAGVVIVHERDRRDWDWRTPDLRAAP
jgi:hypothetical protein